MLSKILEAIYKTGFFHTNTVDAIKLDVYHPQYLYLLWYSMYFKF